MKNRKTKKQAEEMLYNMWLEGDIPSNFTEDHSEYDRAVREIMECGELTWENFF